MPRWVCLMSRMIELIRQSAVPANVMRAAARGALSLPLTEMLEILVQLSAMPLFAQQAQLTLATWDDALLTPVLANAETPESILEYYLSPANRRSHLLPALLQNPAVGEERVANLVETLVPRDLGAVAANDRVRSLPLVVKALLARAEVAPDNREKPRPSVPAAVVVEEPAQVGVEEPAQVVAEEPAAVVAEEAADVAADAEQEYLSQYEEEIRAAEGDPFQLIGPTRDEQAELAAAQVSTATNLAARALAQAPRERNSPIQKICRMTVGERVQLALKGTREERMILIRDGARVVSNAVLHSPRVAEQDVELYASMRNVGDNVLRGIARNRKFMRRYVLKRLLTANPRCPIDVAMPLVKELLVSDLDHLSKNKNVSETVRKFAWRVMVSKRDKK